MIRLSTEQGPLWLDLPHSVRLRVRPLTTSVSEAARLKAHRMVRDAVQSEKDIRDAGGEVVGLPDLDDPEARAGHVNFLFACALAQMSIIAWEGVLAPGSEEPAPINPDTVRALMSISRFAEAFLNTYTAPLELVSAEGNASGLAPSGTSAAGPNIAGGAVPTTSPAPGASGA